MVSVHLYADGEPQGEAVELTAENNRTHTWTVLSLNSEGTAVKYTVEELEVREGYEASINNENHGNLVFTNSYTTKEPTEPEEPDKPGEDRESEDTDQSGESTENGKQTGGSDLESKTETSDGSVESDKEGESGKEEREFPNTRVVLGTTLAGVAMILLLVGGSIMFFTRRKN